MDADETDAHEGARGADVGVRRMVPTSMPQTLMLAVVFAFLGGAIVFFVSERADRPPAPDSVDVGFL
ncbi:MAG: hypothetical protein ACLGIZ_01520, partial [Acidimicrobiia bacterium]